MASPLQISPYGRTSRTPRRPQHTFNVSARPFEVVPVMIAPVLPGETMKNLLFQARVVTDPIVNPLTGWWCEFYFWYVKHRDMDIRDTLVQMMIDPTVTAPTVGTANAGTFRFANGVDYVNQCVYRCIQTYFRDTDELPTVAQSPQGNYLAQLSQMSVLDSACLESAYGAGTADDVVVGGDDTISGQEISQAWILWQQYRAANLTHLSYEEYLATYGIPLPQGSESSHRPELIRYVKDWSYPVNTVDPVTGAPSSAVSWALSERADKDRFFREPGFIFGACCIRPKVYLGGQAGTITGLMKDALTWLPAVMGDNPEYSVRRVPAASGPFPQVTTDYRLDIKDLFMYGEQFTNRGASLPNKVTLPSNTLGKKYPTEADVSALFKNAAGTIKMDGVVSLNILGMQIDTSPTTAPGTF